MEITSRQLQLIGAIAHSGSLARAAQMLGVTPSAVSQQVARFEAELGAQLVHRTSQGTSLSPLGTELALHADRVSAALRDAEESVNRLSGLTAQRLRVGAFASVATTSVPDVLAALRLRHPEAELSVTEMATDEGAQMVADGELDVAVTAIYTNQLPFTQGVEHTHLTTDLLRLIVPDDHPLADRRDGPPVSLSEVRGEAWACSMRSRPARQQIEALAESHGIEMSIPFQTESYDIVLSLVRVGVAVGLVPETAIRDVPGIVVLECTPPAGREIFATVPSSRQHIPLAEEFLSLLKRSFSRADAR